MMLFHLRLKNIGVKIFERIAIAMLDGVMGRLLNFRSDRQENILRCYMKMMKDRKDEKFNAYSSFSL